MKKALIWVGVATVLTGLALYMKYQWELTYKLVYNYKNFKLNFISKDKITITFDFVLENKGDLEINVEKIDIDVYANEVYATRIYADKTLPIKAKSTTSVPMQMIFSPQLIFKNINQLAFGASSLDDMRIKFKGKIKVRKLGMNIPIPFIYSTTYKELMGS